MVVRQSLVERPPEGVRFALVTGDDRSEAVFAATLQDLELEQQVNEEALGIQVSRDEWQDVVPNLARVLSRPTLITLLRSEDWAYAVRAMARFGGQVAGDGEVLKALGALPDPARKETVMAAVNTLTAWRDLGARYGFLSSREVAERVGSKALNKSGAANDLIKSGKVLAVKRSGRYAFPAYQFQTDGSVNPVVAEVLREFRQFGWTDLSIAIWAGSPSGWLGDRAPADVWSDESNFERVLHAARQDATT